MSNLNKRILTSFPLLILSVFAVYNNVILVLSLYFISAILIFEISNILMNIFKRNKINSFIIFACLLHKFIFFFLANLKINKMFFYLFYQFVSLLMLVVTYLVIYSKVKN